MIQAARIHTVRTNTVEGNLTAESLSLEESVQLFAGPAAGSGTGVNENTE